MFKASRLSAVLIAGLTAPALAQEGPGPESVIADQLQAFNDRDIGAAWQYASPMIQEMFGSPENFGRMVQQGYPMVWSNEDARFLEQEEIGGRLYQKVMMRGPRGFLHVLGYEMIRTEDGWKIDGVVILPAPDTGV